MIVDGSFSLVCCVTERTRGCLCRNAKTRAQQATQTEALDAGRLLPLAGHLLGGPFEKIAVFLHYRSE